MGNRDPRIDATIRIAGYAIVALMRVAAPVIAQSAVPTIDSLMERYARTGDPGASVLVIRDGRVSYMKAYGLSDAEGGVPATTESNFRLASLSKQIRLVHRSRPWHGAPAPPWRDEGIHEQHSSLSGAPAHRRRPDESFGRRVRAVASIAVRP